MIRDEQNQSIGESPCDWPIGRAHRGHRHSAPAREQDRGKRCTAAGAFMAGIARRFDGWCGLVFAPGRINGLLRQFLDALSRRVYYPSESGFLDVMAIMLLALTLAVLAEPIMLLIVYAGGGL